MDSSSQSVDILPIANEQQLVVDFEKYVELIETTIDLDQEGHDVYIKPSFDEQLQGVHRGFSFLHCRSRL